MSNQRYSPEFKDEAVRPVIERGYSVRQVDERVSGKVKQFQLGISEVHYA